MSDEDLATGTHGGSAEVAPDDRDTGVQPSLEGLAYARRRSHPGAAGREEDRDRQYVFPFADFVAHPDRGRCEQPDARDRSVSIPDAHESDVRLDDAPGPRRLPAGRDQVETLRDGAWSGEPERRGRDGDGPLADAGDGLLPLPRRGPEGRDGPRPAGPLPGWLDGLPDRSHAHDLGMGIADSAGWQPGESPAAALGHGHPAHPAGRDGFWDEWTLVGPDPKGKYRRVGLIRDVRRVAHECLPGGDGLRPIDLLSKGQVQRVNKLRCLGNGLVIELAAEVIRAYMETHP